MTTLTPTTGRELVERQVGVYQLGEEIGRGQVAVVYRATDTLYDREVALKVLHPYFAHYLSFVRFFIAEGRAGMRLRHPNVVQIYDAGQSDGVAYIAQELISGGTLADMIQARGGPFTVDETVAVIEQAAAGLDYAHHQGYLHRNLKPSNLFFADNGRVQLADFNAATAADGTPPTNYPVATPTFMAPEQARGDATLDPRADIYSLGVITFLMLTGRPPFVADNPLVLLRKIIEETPPLLERAQPGTDPTVAQAVSQALAKRPSARFLTAAAFAHALVHGQPAAPAPPAPASQWPESASALPTAPPQALPVDAVGSPTKAGQITFSRQAVMLAGTIMVTLLLILLLIALRAAPGFFQRITGEGTPVATIALVMGSTGTPAASPQATNERSATATTAAATAVATTSGVQAGSPTAAITTRTTVAAPPTVRILPAVAIAASAGATTTATIVPSNTPSAVATATAMAPRSPTATTTETPTTATELAGSPGAVTDIALSGRIAYTRRNLKTGHLDTAIYNVATGVISPVLAAKRQPDFNNQSDLVLNSEGGGVDALVLMRATGELIGIASAFDEDSHPHWAPNNKSIVFDSALVGDGRTRLYLQQDTNYGQKVSPMMYNAWEIFGRYPVFILDGRIAYNGCDVWENASTCGIFVVNTYGGRPENITAVPGDIPTDNFGNQILAMTDETGNRDVILVDPATRLRRQLTDDPAEDGLATASPDGSFIAFASNRTGDWVVYVMRSDGSDQRKLFDIEWGYGTGDQDWLQQRMSWGR